MVKAASDLVQLDGIVGSGALADQEMESSGCRTVGPANGQWNHVRMGREHPPVFAEGACRKVQPIGGQ